MKYQIKEMWINGNRHAAAKIEGEWTILPEINVNGILCPILNGHTLFPILSDGIVEVEIPDKVKTAILAVSP